MNCGFALIRWLKQTMLGKVNQVVKRFRKLTDKNRPMVSFGGKLRSPELNFSIEVGYI